MLQYGRNISQILTVILTLHDSNALQPGEPNLLQLWKAHLS